MKTKTLLNLALAVVLTLTATPVLAGTVYIPLAADQTIEGHLVETQVRVTNTDSAFIHGFTALFIPTLQDGTTFDREQADEFFVAQGASTVLENLVQPGETGVLEITGDPELAVTARLVTTHEDGTEQLGSEVTPVTSSNIFDANQTAHLLGWTRTAGVRRTDFHVVNLGGDPAECLVTLRAGPGNVLLSNTKLSIPAISHAPYTDALAIVGQANALSMSSSVTCDQRFFTYLTVVDLDGGEILFVPPAATGASSLTPAVPGGGGPDDCDAGAVLCFELPGTFYTPAPGASVRRETFQVPTGSYAGLHFRVEVFHGGWKAPQSGLHSLYWLALNRHYRLIAFSGFHGPGASDVLFRHGMNLDAGSKPKFVVPFKATEGTTYVVDLVWDPTRDFVEQQIRDLSGNVLLSITDAPNVNRMHVEDGEDLTADFSTQAGQNPNEPPTYGWRYSNLLLEVFP